MIRVERGDCREMLTALDADSVHACVTDPPYELGFMGRAWDRTGVAFQPETWRAVLRVMKPGAHLLAFGGTRTYHRLACAIEDAGFEIRDQIGWLFGSGFPKSRDVSKAIDKAAGAERKVVGSKLGTPGYSLQANDTGAHDRAAYGKFTDADAECDITAPATSEAAQWAGWGTALKPAWEPLVVARKPLGERTVAANVLRFGTGALNIDASRIQTGESLNGGAYAKNGADRESYADWRFKRKGASGAFEQPPGRWPANVIHDGSPEVEAAFAAFGESRDGVAVRHRGVTNAVAYGGNIGRLPEGTPDLGYGGGGTASRFFYSSKADSADRADSRHPTVKPVDLMRYLVRLITPPGGTVLDCFAGSGTTAEACMLEGFDALLIEQDAQHIADIEHRVRRWSGLDMPLFAQVAAE